MSCMVIEIIPFENLKEMNLLLKKHAEKNTDIIDHRVVVYKRERFSYDDRI